MDVYSAAEFWSTIRLIVILAAVFVFLWYRRGGRPLGREGAEDEGRTIQAIYQGLERMERRVDHLETILLEREAKQEQKGN